LRHRRPSGIPQAEQLAVLSKASPGGVVHGFAEQLVAPDAGYVHELGVPPETRRANEREVRRGGRQQRRKEVPFEVMEPTTGRSRRLPVRVRC